MSTATYRAPRLTSFYVLLKLKNDPCSGLPVFVEARTRRIAIKKAKRASLTELDNGKPGHWVTDVAHRWTSDWS